jgi:hypothetical protein
VASGIQQHATNFAVGSLTSAGPLLLIVLSVPGMLLLIVLTGAGDCC